MKEQLQTEGLKANRGELIAKMKTECWISRAGPSAAWPRRQCSRPGCGSLMALMGPRCWSCTLAALPGIIVLTPPVVDHRWHVRGARRCGRVCEWPPGCRYGHRC